MPFTDKPATAEDVQDLINWLETKTGKYDEQNPKDCAIARYLRDRGYKNVTFWGMHQLKADGNQIRLPKVIGEIVYTNENHVGSIFTKYAKALERAREVHAKMTYAIKPAEDPGAGFGFAAGIGPAQAGTDD